MQAKRTRMTRDNTAVLLIDHQVGLMTGVRDMSVGELKHNVVGLAKAARALGLPIVAVTTARDSMWGPTAPELKEALGGGDIMMGAARRPVRGPDHKTKTDVA
jgi:nicotinamidase-related amidase